MYRTILVPLDGSTFSAQALPVAAALARRTGAALRVVTVIDPSAYVPFVPGEVLVPVLDTEALAARREVDRGHIEAEAAKLRADGVEATGALLEGTVVDALAEDAAASGADLVMMTTHGRSGIEKLWLGSVATAFLHKAPCPVYLVRPDTGDDAAPAPALPEGRMLVPLDGSPFAESILPHARRFAEAAGLTLELFSVVVPSALPMAPFGAEAILADDSEVAAQERDTKAWLAHLAADLPEGTTTRVVTEMTAPSAILQYAQESHPGVVAMATHGRSGIVRLVLGSVAERVLKEAPAPLFLYRPDPDAVKASGASQGASA
jgi:nucleotide-binding universal stress UspA family protein